MSRPAAASRSFARRDPTNRGLRRDPSAALFFVVAGLKIEVGLLDQPGLWLITLGLIAVAITGKLLGAMVASRFTGAPLRESAAVGVLMNTRGLTELIVLNAWVLVTTFMAAPLLRLIAARAHAPHMVTLGDGNIEADALRFRE